MTKMTKFLGVLVVLLSFFSCEKEIRNIAPDGQTGEPNPTEKEIIPVNINDDGFEFLEKMQGHWVGPNRVIADDFDWFAFDYRAISPSHVHGIFEGGTMGNLFTSFFVTDFKDTRTIMARNGGVLNGIYRTSYFVMDSVDHADGDYYRFVDAAGGTNTMWMELRFVQDSLYFNAYTSRLGLTFPPTRHMTFKGKREHPELAQTAAAAVGFPQNVVAWDFSEGFMEEYLQASPGAKSATFLAQEDIDTDVFTLAEASGDPFKILDHPYLGFLQLDVVRNENIMGKSLFVNLSRDPLTDDFGYFSSLEAFNTILLFPEIIGAYDQFLVTYLHPGDYYVTIIADVNEDGFVSEGDYTHVSQPITIDPEGQHQITIDNITVQN